MIIICVKGVYLSTDEVWWRPWPECFAVYGIHGFYCIICDLLQFVVVGGLMVVSAVG